MKLSRKELRSLMRKKEKEGSGEILEEIEDGFIYFDVETGKDIKFTLQEKINIDWLLKRIYINPKVKYKYELNEKEIARLLLLNLPTEYFMTLNYVFIMYRSSDFKMVAKKLYHNKDEEIQSEIVNAFDDIVGMMGFVDNSIFINMRNIEKIITKLYNSDLYKEKVLCFWSTIFHEMRHLMLETNIFLDRKEYPTVLNEELNVELFGHTLAMNMRYE